MEEPHTTDAKDATAAAMRAGGSLIIRWLGATAALFLILGFLASGFLFQQSKIDAPASPTATPLPPHVPFYELPTPAPEVTPLPTTAEGPAAAGLAIATPTPEFTPNPEVLSWANTMIAQRPWLEARSSDQNLPPGSGPATTFIVSRVEPIVTRDGDTWKITFKP